MLRSPCLSLLALLCAPAGAQVDKSPIRLPETLGLLEGLSEEKPELGYLVVAVTEHRLGMAAVGFSNADREIPMQDSTRIPLGSLTRTLLQLSFDRVSRDSKLSWDRPMHELLPVLPDAIGKRAWQDVSIRGQGFLPNYARFVTDPEEARSLDEVIAAHAFRPKHVRLFADARSMLPAAMLQRALELQARTSWTKLLRDTARSIGARGVHATEPKGGVGVVRHDRDGQPIDSWIAEIPAANGATGTGYDVAALLRHLMTYEEREAGKRLNDPFCGFRQGSDGEAAWLESRLDIPGISGNVRIYDEPGLAVLAFVNRAQARELDRIQTSALDDYLNRVSNEEVTEQVELAMDAEAASPPAEETRKWHATLTLHDKALPLQIKTETGSASLHAQAGRVVSSHISNHEGRVFAYLSVHEFAVHGGTQRTLIDATVDGNKLLGFVSYREQLRGVGEVYKLPFPIQFAELPPNAKLEPIVPRR